MRRERLIVSNSVPIPAQRAQPTASLMRSCAIKLLAPICRYKCLICEAQVLDSEESGVSEVLSETPFGLACWLNKLKISLRWLHYCTETIGNEHFQLAFPLVGTSTLAGDRQCDKDYRNAHSLPGWGTRMAPVQRTPPFATSWSTTP